MKQATKKLKTTLGTKLVENPKFIKKHVPKMNHWVPKPTRMEILVCTCGNKYIKTRVGQEVCVRCLNKIVVNN